MSNSLKAAQLLSGRAGVHTQAVWLWSLWFLITLLSGAPVMGPEYGIGSEVPSRQQKANSFQAGASGVAGAVGTHLRRVLLDPAVPYHRITQSQQLGDQG